MTRPLPETDELEWVRLAFVDVLGRSCALAVPASRFAEASSDGVLFDGSALEGPARYLEVDMRLLADPATLVALGGGEARATCTVLSPDGSPWPGDPRNALHVAIDEAGDLADDLTTSVELEFYLLDPDGRPIDDSGYFGDARHQGWEVVRRSASELEGLGVAVASCHHEDGPGQFEIDLLPQGLMATADSLVAAKETIRRMAGAVGLQATFMARPISDEAGSGLHIHQRSGLLLRPDGELTMEGRSFIAGQLAHAAALAALASPTVNSYRRLHAGPEAPSSAIWSTANRSALVRVGGGSGAARSIEYRGADPLANPYLVLAGLLATGVGGIEAGLSLGPPIDEGTGFDPASARRFESLPRNLDEALDALMRDDLLVELFDPTLLANLVDGRRSELEAFRSHVTSWERERYLKGA